MKSPLLDIRHIMMKARDFCRLIENFTERIQFYKRTYKRSNVRLKQCLTT